MSNALRQATTVVLTISTFSIVTALGQSDRNRARKASANVALTERGRAPSRQKPPRPTVKLPFPQAVTIYYKGPKDVSLSPITRPDDHTVKTRVATGPPSNIPSDSRAKTLGLSQLVGPIQPVFIYYNRYHPIPVNRSATSAVPGNEAKPQATPIPAKKTAKDTSKPDVAKSSYDFSPRLNRVESRVPASDQNDEIAVSESAPASPVFLQARSVNRQPATDAELAPNTSAEREIAETPVVASSEPLGSTIYKRRLVSISEPKVDASSDLSTAPADAGEASAPAPVISNDSSSSTGSKTVQSEVGRMDAVDLNNSAIQLTMQHQYTQARSLLEQAIEADAEVAKLHRNLSIVYEKLEMMDKAMASARTAEELSPMEPSIIEQRCGLELAMENVSAALGCYEKLSSIRPLDVLEQTYVGMSLFKAGKVDESVSVLEKAAKSTPPVPAAINALGVVYFNTKRIKDAAAVFKNAVESAPDMLESRYNLAVTQMSLDNKAGAMSHYNILKLANPDLAAQLFRIIFSDKIVAIPRN